MTDYRILGKFKPALTACATLVLFLIFASVPAMLISDYVARGKFVFSASTAFLPAFVFATPYMVTWVFSVLFNVIFRNARSIYTHNGKLIYVNPILFSVRLTEISYVTMSPWRNVKLHLHSGRIKILPANRLLTQPPEAIREQLIAILG